MNSFLWQLCHNIFVGPSRGDPDLLCLCILFQNCQRLTQIGCSCAYVSTAQGQFGFGCILPYPGVPPTGQGPVIPIVGDNTCCKWIRCRPIHLVLPIWVSYTLWWFLLEYHWVLFLCIQAFLMLSSGRNLQEQHWQNMLLKWIWHYSGISWWGEVCCGGPNIIRVVDQVSSHDGSCPVGFIFLGPDGAHKSDVGNVFEPILWHFTFCYEIDCVCALYPSSNSLCQVPKFICRYVPILFKLGMMELPIFEQFPHAHINNCEGLFVWCCCLGPSLSS